MPVRISSLRFLGLNSALSFLHKLLEVGAQEKTVPANAMVWYISAQPSHLTAREFLPSRKALLVSIVGQERRKLSQMSSTENQNPATAIRVLHLLTFIICHLLSSLRTSVLDRVNLRARSADLALGKVSAT